MSSPGSCRLQAIIQKNRIRSRPTVLDCASWTEIDASPLAIDELSQVFRTLGVDMTVSACKKALKEAHLLASDVTHVVAVTCTDQGSPGYDLSVTRKLRLGFGVQRTLLHGVGCAGGLSALREAANLAVATTARNRPARIPAFATELSSLFLRAETQAACSDDQEVDIALSLFSDASATLVVCNDMGLITNEEPIYKLQEWSGALLPGTEGHMSYCVSPSGMIATITRDVPRAVVGAISSMFSQICGSSYRHLAPSAFDWAIHPGGLAILRGAQLEMGLTDDHIRDSLEVYQQCGNSSSPTVLIVLDRLRSRTTGRENVIATSFGPGLMVEMVHVRKCCSVSSFKVRGQHRLADVYILSTLLLSRFFNVGKRVLSWHAPKIT